MALETLYPYWSYVLPGFGLIALYAGGSRKRWGWAVGFTGEMLWITYGLTTHQYGFALSGLAFAIVYARIFCCGTKPEFAFVLQEHRPGRGFSRVKKHRLGRCFQMI
jgi:hypothetical protein